MSSQSPVALPTHGDRKSKRPSWPKSLTPGARPKTVDDARYQKAADAGTVLVVDNVSVSFDGFKALSELTLLLDEGELRCIIGPNGAGKTTLQDVITGKTRPDEGSVFMVGDPRELTELAEEEIAALGIGRKFQKPTVFGQHSVYENLELALQRKKSVWSSLFHEPTPAQHERIEQVLETVGLQEEQKQAAGGLSHGQKQWLEIGMLLAQAPKVLLVDEPVAGMTLPEMERTARLLESLAGKHTVVVVEHDMDFVRSIAKKVTVLHEGKVLAEGNMDAVQNDPRVVEVYLGE